MRRPRFVLDVATPPNRGARNGVYALEGSQDDDGVIGTRTFVRLWAGIEDANNLSDTPDAPTLSAGLFYFDDLMPYRWR